jgi:hypothetical protein
MVCSEPAGLIVEDEAFPMLHDLAGAEACGTQCVGRLLGQRRWERDDDRFLAFVAQPRLTREGASAEGSPSAELILVAGGWRQNTKPRFRTRYVL